MAMALIGIGTAQPGASIDQARAAAFAATKCCATPQQQRLLATIYRQSAVQQRASVLLELDADESGDGAANGPCDLFYPERAHAEDRGPAVGQRMLAYVEHALPLTLRAAEQALAQARVDRAQVRQIIIVTCTGFASPGLDVRLIDALRLAPDIGRTTIGFMGCHGAINGLRVAQALAEREPDAAVLMCAVELCSLHFQYGWSTQRAVANALFADGAAAVVGIHRPESEVHRPESIIRSPKTMDYGGSTMEDRHGRITATGSCLLPDSQDAMTWTIGDHGFEMTLSQSVPQVIEAHLKPWLTQWLAGQGLTLDEVGSWAVHPGGPRILDAVQTALGLAADALNVARQVLSECGNMSSPTVLFIADRLQRQAAARPCVMLAFGPGLVAEAALLV